MDADIRNNTLTIESGKRMDGSNVRSLEEEWMGLLDQYPGFKVVLDLKKLEYISSAGIRLIMKLQKKSIGFSAVNVSEAVYEILDLTGLTSALDIRRSRRFVSINGLKMISQGGYGKIYRLTEDTILKVFYGFTSDELIENGIRYARKAFSGGIPCAVPYEAVDTEEGIGVVYEYLHSVTLAEAIHASPELLEDYSLKFARLGRTLSQTHFPDHSLRSADETFSHALDRFSGLLEDDDIALYNRAVDLIPKCDTAVHGDFHTKNVLLGESGELLLIDMDDFCCGHPIWDLITTVSYCEDAPHPFRSFGDSLLLTGLTDEEKNSVWNYFIREYFRELPPEEIQSRVNVIIMYSALHLIRIILDRCPDKDRNDPGTAYCVGMIHSLLAGFTESGLQEAEELFRVWK